MPKIVVDTAEIYDTNEAAHLLGIGYATLYRWIKDGKLIPLRVGGRTLIPKSEVERLKNKQSHPGSPRNIMGLLPKFEKVLREYSKQTN